LTRVAGRDTVITRSKLLDSTDFSARQAQWIAGRLREPAARMDNDNPSAEVVRN
jgi:hypothetical protein